jgi:hypothetical protein
MSGLPARWRERRERRDNAAYLAEEVELIDLAALERQHEELWEIDLRDPEPAER